MKVFVGIPCFRDVAGETLEDYMRLMYYLGRRTEHDYFLGIKTKTEQFRARNAIVEGAIQTGCDYLFFLDDDHVIDWETSAKPNSRYGLIDTLIGHCEADPEIGIVGVVYYHRGAECRPVLMKEGKDGGFYWMRDDEITGGLQEVAVQGGGCFLINMKVFDKIESPWFQPELDHGTDIQICTKARGAGFKVCCDTSIQIGHVMTARQVVTPENRLRISTDSARQHHSGNEGIDPGWKLDSALRLYRMDAEEYLGMKFEDMSTLACQYDARDFAKWEGGAEDYYASKGREQLARQVLFHHTEGMQDQMNLFLGMINTQAPGYGADVGCGSAPIGFELALRGHKMDFIDIHGAGAYEFTKWRAKKSGVDFGLSLEGPYDYVLMMDSIEHIENWKEMLFSVSCCLKEGGALITNYFLNNDFENPEHISMDHAAVRNYLKQIGIYPMNEVMWTKTDLGFMDDKDKSESETRQ